MRPVLSSLALVTLLLATACGDEARSAGSDSEPRKTIGAVELDGVVLRPEEGPPGTMYIAERSGTLSIEELWPSDCCPGQQLAFEAAGFRTAYGRVFQKPGYSGEPIDTRPGWELVSSAAVLFDTPAGAAEAMDAWLGYFESPVLKALSAEGLGDEAVAVGGSPEAPAEVFYLYLWRIDRAVLSLRASTGTGTVSEADVRALVDLMDQRVT